jgi:hypothetical protein
MVSHSLVIGYHGCDQRIARKVIALDEHLKASQNAWDWLGHGIYFWEESPSRAQRWAEVESRRRGGKIKFPAVLGAIIDLGNCLNLAEAEALTQVKIAYEEYVESCRSAGIETARNSGPGLRLRYLDCAVMETLQQLRHEENKQPFDTVRGFFIEGQQLYADAGFRELDHVQICVRSPRQIIGCFWPRPAPSARG